MHEAWLCLNALLSRKTPHGSLDAPPQGLRAMRGATQPNGKPARHALSLCKCLPPDKGLKAAFFVIVERRRPEAEVHKLSLDARARPSNRHTWNPWIMEVHRLSTSLCSDQVCVDLALHLDLLPKLAKSHSKSWFPPPPKSEKESFCYMLLRGVPPTRFCHVSPAAICRRDPRLTSLGTLQKIRRDGTLGLSHCCSNQQHFAYCSNKKGLPT